MRKIWTPQSIYRLAFAVLIATSITACTKEKQAAEPVEKPLDELAWARENGKKIGEFYVAKNSIILSADASQQLKAVTSDRLTFSKKPVNADSMSTDFIINNTIPTTLSPNGFLVKSTGSFEDAEGFHVQYTEIPITDYILYAKAEGEIHLDDNRYRKPRITNPRAKLAASATQVPMAQTNKQINQLLALSYSNVIDPGNFNFDFPVTVLGRNSASIQLDIHPTLRYAIDISALKRRANLSFLTNLALNNLGATFKLDQDVPLFNYNGDELFIPLVIPLGPIVINPYFSISPYARISKTFNSTLVFKSSGNLSFNLETENARALQQRTTFNYQVERPRITELATSGNINFGVQTTWGIGFYGKSAYGQVQAKFGPDFSLAHDLITKQSTLAVAVNAEAIASVGLSIATVPLVNKTVVLLSGSIYSNQWIFPWTK
ncbi:hypothetical protein J5U18_08695 [Sphingobacteriaceae bacterium WQ 2009]|uniref:DUF4270 family protein n=1 Tax=Rhinopithecimicrobium faecis TaxID=2820698 RepID=A0A8T4HE63_9SPHI|nr:hypothetical protein [Sphingobacteriaceae bacterium WQ 2009]